MDYKIEIPEFEGPLDLLLHLIKQSNIDIKNICIDDITKQYLKYINLMEELNLNIASEYLVMSSELIHLKSKLLINRHDEESIPEDEFSFESEEDLREKLLEYEKYKKITKDFQELEEKRGEVYTKLPESLKEDIEESNLPKGEFEINDLFNAYMLFIERQKLAKPLNTKITRKELSVDDKIKDIRNILNVKKRVNFLELFDVITKETIVVTFLSILEMTKSNEIILTQEESFSPIMIEKRV